MLQFILVQGFCALKIIITRFPDGFRLNTLGPFGAGGVQVDVFFLKIGVGLPSFAFRVRHILMTRKYLASPTVYSGFLRDVRARYNVSGQERIKKISFSSRKTNLNSFYSPQEACELKPSPENITKNFTHHMIYTPRPKVWAENPPD